jgi:hypothetical protein
MEPPFPLHAGRQHVSVIPVAGYDLIALLQGHLHADHHGLLPDIEVAEAADRTHAIELAGLFLETPDQEHVAERSEVLFPGELRRRAVSLFELSFLRAFLGCGHGNSG